MEGFQQYNIQDGITLNYICDKKYKTVSMSLFLNRELKRDEVTKNSLLSNVLKRGTTKLKTMTEISRYLESLYGALYNISVLKKGNVNSIAFEFSFLSEAYSQKEIGKKCIDLLMDFLFDGQNQNGGFIPQIVETEKVNLRDEIAAVINDKRSYADYRCLEEMFRDEKSGVFELGYIEDIKDIDHKNLYEHYQNIIKSSPIDIFIVGDIDIKEYLEYFKEVFEKHNFNISNVKITPELKDAPTVKTITDKLDVSQGKLSMGFRTKTCLNSPEYSALLVGNSILGAGAHSKLFNNVREKLSLCYYVSSRLDKFNGAMIIASGVEFENFDKAIKEITAQLNAVKNGDFTNEDFKIAKDFIITSYKSFFDSPFLIKDYYLGNVLSGTDVSIEKAIEKISTVTTEDVIKAFSPIQLDTVYMLKGISE